MKKILILLILAAATLILFEQAPVYGQKIVFSKIHVTLEHKKLDTTLYFEVSGYFNLRKDTVPGCHEDDRSLQKLREIFSEYEIKECKISE